MRAHSATCEGMTAKAAMHVGDHKVSLARFYYDFFLSGHMAHALCTQAVLGAASCHLQHPARLPLQGGPLTMSYGGQK